MVEILSRMLLVLCFVVAVWAIYMLVRNQAVYRFRARLLATDIERYERLPGYNDMLDRWWVWPLSRFEPKPPPNPRGGYSAIASATKPVPPRGIRSVVPPRAVALPHDCKCCRCSRC